MQLFSSLQASLEEISFLWYCFIKYYTKTKGRYSLDMKLSNKIKLLQKIATTDVLQETYIRDTIYKCGFLKSDYNQYMSEHPINCDRELLHLSSADYDRCCALLTMLLREDHFCNGAFEYRIRNGDVKLVIDRLIYILKSLETPYITSFSEKTLEAINGYYVYALIDPRTNSVFYIGKGTGNRIFSHELESQKPQKSEKEKLQKIRDIEKSGFHVKRIMINWGLTESEAFIAEATLINLFNVISENQLTNIVAGHHIHESLTVEDFEIMYGAEPLKAEDIKHNILVIKINKLYRRNMTNYEIYDAVRGMWRASLNSIKSRNIRYVFGVYNSLIVGVYKPDEWHYVYEKIDLPQHDKTNHETLEKLKDRVYFICKKYDELDDEGSFYLHKSIANLKVNQTSQNPISYLMTET